MQFDRRSLIRTAGQLAIVAGLAPQRLVAAPTGAYPFTLGVASGDPWPDGFVIWTRLAPRPLEEHGGMPHAAVQVGWEVAEDDRFTRIVRKGDALARPELAHSVHVELSGLKPQRRYWYRFTLPGSEASPSSRSRGWKRCRVSSGSTSAVIGVAKAMQVAATEALDSLIAP